MFWLYPLLRLGICEDLRARLKSSVPYYSCLSAIAVVDTPLTQPTIPDTTQTREIAGTVEIALREREGLNECALRKEHPHSVKSQGENEGNYLYISNLAVSPAYRRQGIARKLLLSCEPLARQWGYREIYLHVLENNDRAKQLYFNLGYDINRIEPQKNNWIWPHPKCLLLRKSLAVR